MAWGPDYSDLPIEDVGMPIDESWREPARFVSAAEALKAPRRDTRETRFRRVSFAELRARKKVKAPDYVVDGWMQPSEMSMLAGESQSGKSFLALHTGLSVATGRDVLGRRTSAGLVIYQAGESGSGVTDLRIPAWIQHYGSGLDDKRVPFEILPARVDLWSPEGNARQFIEAVKNIAAEYAPIPLRAVFIDTLSKAMAGANENDGRDVGRVLANAETIVRATGAHVCIVHHFSKAGKQMRGHGSLRADVDTVAMVTVDEATKVRTLSFDKVKDGEAGGRERFELMQVRLGERDDGKPITSCVIVPLGEKASRRPEAQVGASVNVSTMHYLKAFFDALDEFGLPAPPPLKVNGNVRVVANQDVNRVYAKLNPFDAIEKTDNAEERELEIQRHKERLKKRIKAARDYLLRVEVLALEDGLDPGSGKNATFLWWTGRPVRGMQRTQAPRAKVAEVDQMALDELAGVSDLDGVL